MALTTYLTNLMLAEHFPSTASHWIGLHVSDPTNAGLANTELSSVTIPTYGRKQVTWSAPANRSVYNTNALQWTGLPSTEIGYLGVWDAQTGGHMLAVLVCREVLLITNAGAPLYCPEGSLAVVMGGSPEQRVAQLTPIIVNDTPIGPIPPATPGGPPNTAPVTS